MPAFAIAHLEQVDFGPEIAAYLQAIDATLTPFGGTFLLHGGGVEVVEGAFAGDVVVIAFPNLDRRARGIDRQSIRRSFRYGHAMPAAGRSWRMAGSVSV